MELQELLEPETADFAGLFDVARAAAFQRLLNLARNGDRMMQTYPASVMSLAKKPSAFVPVAMSLCAFAVVVGSVATYGSDALRRETDEGSAAHIVQLLMAGQLPNLPSFAFQWLGRAAKAGVSVLLLQIAPLGVARQPARLRAA